MANLSLPGSDIRELPRKCYCYSQGGRPCLLAVQVVRGSAVLSSQLTSCHLLLVTLGKFLSISGLVSISVKQRCRLWERKEALWENV